MKTTTLAAALLAVVTVVAAGLAVVPNSLQEAQANPCATEFENNLEIDSDEAATQSSSNSITSTLDNRECSFIGPVDIDED